MQSSDIYLFLCLGKKKKSLINQHRKLTIKQLKTIDLSSTCLDDIFFSDVISIHSYFLIIVIPSSYKILISHRVNGDATNDVRDG